MKISAGLAQIRRLLRPPRIVAVTRRPAGWLAVGRAELHYVLAWAQFDDGRIAGLVADRRGLRPAWGRRFRGYLPGAARSARDLQLSPPAVSVPVADLEEAIGLGAGATDASDELAAIYGRLKIAAEDEWATEAMLAFVADPDRFLRRHSELIAEHGRPAELSAIEREWLARLTTKTPSGSTRGDARAPGGKRT